MAGQVGREGGLSEASHDLDVVVEELFRELRAYGSRGADYQSCAEGARGNQ